ncbi:helix-turn-helix domain-containing protein [Burkholderia sp. S171]|uniref:helix-turn-helix domain-containing protein n=1 Tax=Burkholderia sp. S171 TaxID=1641860 RepID=UPI00131EA9CF|nr:helix-turn-helix domain-containing protein [Burkholderia sp. S171]
MITAFGDYVRSLRQKHSELLRDMAVRLQVTSAFLSAVETGRKSIPGEWFSRLVTMYALPKIEAEKLRQAIDESQRSVIIDLDGTSALRRGVAVALARRFNEMSDQELNELRQSMFLSKPNGEK